jgi:N-acetyl-gamma-glutamyl-phosphate/LysW-gamma-L-alpha-aminoadipyl-6-phosphate reductase
MKASIVGASGYGGGELLRLLLGHPKVEVAQVTSERQTGQFVYGCHPNLRGRTELKFSSSSDLEPVDCLFLALPHGEAMGRIVEFARLAPRIVDLSADFRLRAATDYARWYGNEHTAPQWLEAFTYGLPELHREQIRTADYVSGVGCNATATILALLPLVRSGLIDRERDIIVDLKVGSSEAGASMNPGSHHPERSGSVRSFAPTGHRHTAEVVQELSGAEKPLRVHLSVTSVEMVRGVLATAHAFASPALDEPLAMKALWSAYRAAYEEEPFVRIVRVPRGIHRYPDPKILAGSNYCDVGFDVDEQTGRVVSIAAIDNLMKGSAGTAVQAMNIMLGWEETLGLEFPGLHPI